MRSMLIVAGVVAGLGAGLTNPAAAESDPIAQAHLAAANQLGLLQNCKSQGFVGDDALAAERTAIGRLPPSAVQTEAAEAAGKRGEMAMPNGTQTSLADIANGQKTTVADLCRRMGEGVMQAARMTQPGLPAGTATGMPRMPNMPAGMPSMPSMPSMPAMPGAPASR